MKVARLLLPTVALCVLLGGPLPQAAADWPLFGGSDKADKKATAGSRPAFDGKPMHAIIPSQPQHEPSVWDRMNRGTKSFFSGARDMLTFRKPAATTSTVSRPTGYGQASQAKAKKPGFLGSLFSSEAKPKESSTPQEWLAQERPKMF